MRITLLFFACSVFTALTGCGLLLIPHISTLPPPHFRSVLVCEAGSNQPIVDASVRYEGYYASNWIKLQGKLNAKPASELYSHTPPNVVRDACQQESGHFVLKPVQRLEWSHILCPIGLPLGGVMYHYYSNSLVVEAPGHIAVRISGGVPAESDSPYFTYKDQLTVFLPRSSQ